MIIKNKRQKNKFFSYNFFPKSCKGTEKILSIYWFAILIIIAGAVVAMVNLFYGAPYDARDAEANIMINQVSGCLSGNGELNQKLFKETKTFNDGFNLKEECSLVFETEFKGEREEYFLEANFYNLDNDKIFSISDGNSNLYADCKVNPEEKYKKLSKCVDREFYSSTPFSEDEVFKIKIISVIRKTEKNVK